MAPTPQCEEREKLLVELKGACEKLVAVHTAEVAAITKSDVGELLALQQRVVYARRDRTIVLNALRKHTHEHGC